MISDTADWQGASHLFDRPHTQHLLKHRIVLMAWYLVKHRKNVTLPYYTNICPLFTTFLHCFWAYYVSFL